LLEETQLAVHIRINVLGDLRLEDLVIDVEKHLIEVHSFPVAASIDCVTKSNLRPFLVAAIIVRLGQGDEVWLDLTSSRFGVPLVDEREHLVLLAVDLHVPLQVITAALVEEHCGVVLVVIQLGHTAKDEFLFRIAVSVCHTDLLRSG